MKWIAPLICAVLTGCSFNPERGGSIRPLEQPAAVATVRGQPSTVAECLYRQLDARLTPDVHRTRPANSTDEIIYFGTSGARPWEITISPSGPTNSTVTFRSLATIRGNDAFWRDMALERAACGF
jgi:hypothetical protein